LGGNIVTGAVSEITSNFSLMSVLNSRGFCVGRMRWQNRIGARWKWLGRLESSRQSGGMAMAIPTGWLIGASGAKSVGSFMILCLEGRAPWETWRWRCLGRQP
jgi:hypothetical protein